MTEETAAATGLQSACRFSLAAQCARPAEAAEFRPENSVHSVESGDPFLILMTYTHVLLGFRHGGPAAAHDGKGGELL